MNAIKHMTKKEIAGLHIDRIPLRGLKLEMPRVRVVLGRQDQGRGGSGAPKQDYSGGRERLRPVSLFSIESSREAHPSCTCEEMGLHEGMTLHELQKMGAGCTGSDSGGVGWVCGRLSSIRRSYGL